jgi:hypothetical protein
MDKWFDRHGLEKGRSLPFITKCPENWVPPKHEERDEEDERAVRWDVKDTRVTCDMVQIILSFKIVSIQTVTTEGVIQKANS